MDSRQQAAVAALGLEPFTRRTARDRGVTGNVLDALHGRGLVRQPLRGVYLSASADTHEPRVRAACVALALPERAAISRLTAAWLWGVDARGPGLNTTALPIQCTVPVGQEPLRRPGLQCFTAPLGEADITRMAGVPCTTPLRTAVDLLRWLAPHMGLGAADALAHRGLITPEALLTELERWSGRPGIINARRLAALVEPLTESFGESWTRLRVIDAGFPRPTPQIPLLDDAGRVLYRLDMGWPSVRKALEYDGEEYHSGRENNSRDKNRREHIRRRFEWDVIPVGRGEVLGRSLALEQGIGEVLGLEPQIRMRSW